MTDNQPYMDKEAAIIFLMNNPNVFIMDINTNVIWCLEKFRTSSVSDSSIDIQDYLRFPNSRFVKVCK